MALSAAITAPASDEALINAWLATKKSRHTHRAYRSDIETFQKVVPTGLQQITEGDLDLFNEHLAMRKLKAATRARAFIAVKSLLSYGHETGYLRFNAGAKWRLHSNSPRPQRRILSESDVALLIANAPIGRNRVILTLLYYSGIRVGELAALKWSDTKELGNAGEVTIVGNSRTIQLKTEAWAMLMSLRSGPRISDPVFRSRKGGGHLDASQIRRIVYEAAHRAGFIYQKISPDWLRHSHGSHALNHDAPIDVVQATLGHASVATTAKYLHSRPGTSSSAFLPELPKIDSSTL